MLDFLLVTRGTVAGPPLLGAAVEPLLLAVWYLLRDGKNSSCLFARSCSKTTVSEIHAMVVSWFLSSMVILRSDDCMVRDASGLSLEDPIPIESRIAG